MTRLSGEAGGFVRAPCDQPLFQLAAELPSREFSKSGFRRLFEPPALACLQPTLGSR